MSKKIDLLNPKIYIPNFLKIRTKEGTLEPFIPNKPQRKLRDTIAELREAGKPVRIIILKDRQMGFSTETESIIFKNVVFPEPDGPKIDANSCLRKLTLTLSSAVCLSPSVL